ncbi:MAG: hypothetical protein K2O01_01115, partial [Bacteroidales bacterium]|nr:hypothetical protein [Bacteroidales bacterium]
MGMKHGLVRYLLFSVVVWFGIHVSVGQDRVVLEGYVRDTAGGPVPYATVALWRIPDGSGAVSGHPAVAEGWGRAGGGVSDTNGYYRVEVLMSARYLFQ